MVKASISFIVMLPHTWKHLSMYVTCVCMCACVRLTCGLIQGGLGWESKLACMCSNNDYILCRDVVVVVFSLSLSNTFHSVFQSSMKTS